LVHLGRVLCVVLNLLDHGFFDIFIKIILVFVLFPHIFIKVVLLIEVILVIFVSCWRLRLLVGTIINPERGLNAHDLSVFFVDLRIKGFFRVRLLDFLFI